jgi:hypothetical protein
VSIADADDFKVATFIKTKEDNAPFGAVGKGGERFIESLRSASVCGLHFDIGKFTLVLLDFGYQLLEFFAGHDKYLFSGVTGRGRNSGAGLLRQLGADTYLG